MIGTSIGNLVLAWQHEARKVLKETKGDRSRVVGHMLSYLHAGGAFDAEDLKSLEASFAEASRVFAGKVTPSKGLTLSRARYASMVARHKSSDVARALAELCVSVIADAAAVPSKNTGPGVVANAASAPGGTSADQSKGEKILLGALVGAVVGFDAGGLPGAVLGAAIGAVVGACADSITLEPA